MDVAPSVEYLEGGNDKGRDILFTGSSVFFGNDSKSRKCVFQVKHKTSNSSFGSLSSDLRSEIFKVFVFNKLPYNSYTIVTNLNLSANQNDELREIVNGVFSANNLPNEIEFRIYSYRNIESCLDRSNSLKLNFPSVIKHSDFSLIIKEAVVKNRIRHSSTWQTIFEKNRVRFVLTGCYVQALSVIGKNRILLLAGPPKSGKTFTAEMILLHKTLDQGYSPFKINQIEEFQEYYDPNERQIFLFDDAFGKHNLDPYKADQYDRILNFIFESLNENHLIVFTSREYIYKAFKNYTGQDLASTIDKVTVDIAILSNGEKEGILIKYHSIGFPSDGNLNSASVGRVIANRNYSPENIRSYYDTAKEFNLQDLVDHLNNPDNYLKKVFLNLTEDKRIVLLAVLFSSNGKISSIAYSFQNVCADLDRQLLISLTEELNILVDSILKVVGDRYGFYHPTMFDFFVKYLGDDAATYRKLLLNNFNLSLLNLTGFERITPYGRNTIKLQAIDLDLLMTGIKRLFSNPELNLNEINSFFAWHNIPDTQFNLKLSFKSHYQKFKATLYNSLSSLNILNFKNESCIQLSTFLTNTENVLNTRNDMFISEQIFDELLYSKKQDHDYWLLAFRTSCWTSEEFVMNKLDRNWLNNFYLELKQEIRELGLALYGPAYPDFIEVAEYNRLMKLKDYVAAGKITKRNRSDFMQKTNKNWYPRYQRCLEKMNVLKSCQPYGLTIYEKLLPLFEPLKKLEDRQANRYFFLKEQEWW